MNSKFFVYGTLKIGGRFAKMFDSVRLSSKSATLTGFDLYSINTFGATCAFPAAIYGDGKIIGELHEFPEELTNEVLSEIDYIEGYRADDLSHSLYIREIVWVALEDGSRESAFFYKFNRPRDCTTKIESGIWKI